MSPEARHQELLDAAIRVLRERGPANCRVEDVTAEAHTAKGNFYRSFPTWDDLLVAVRDRFITFQLDRLHEAIFHGAAAMAEPVEQDGFAASIVAGLLAAGIADGEFFPRRSQHDRDPVVRVAPCCPRRNRLGNGL